MTSWFLNKNKNTPTTDNTVGIQHTNNTNQTSLDTHLHQSNNLKM